MQHLFSRFTRRMASRVNGDCPAANLHDKPLARNSRSKSLRPLYITWNEFTSCRNAYGEMILWRDSFSAKTHVLEKSLIPLQWSYSLFYAQTA